MDHPLGSELEQYQETMTRDDFVRLLDGVYAPGGAAKEVIETQEDGAVIKTTLSPPATWKLRFAGSPADEITGSNKRCVFGGQSW